MPLSTLLIALAFAIGVLSAKHGGFWWIAMWPALNFLISGVAHARGWHRVFGKQRDGRLPFSRQFAFAPLLLYTHLVWRVIRLFSREPAWQQITPQLFVGRRLLPGEIDAPFDNWLDLTAEFVEPQPFRSNAAYIALPILDGSALSPEQLAAALDQLRPGRTFIHCAQGHGRTGFVAAALLLYGGEAANPQMALEQLQAVRSGIRLNKKQQSALEDFACDAAGKIQPATESNRPG